MLVDVVAVSRFFSLLSHDQNRELPAVQNDIYNFFPAFNEGFGFLINYKSLIAFGKDVFNYPREMQIKC